MVRYGEGYEGGGFAGGGSYYGGGYGGGGYYSGTGDWYGYYDRDYGRTRRRGYDVSLGAADARSLQMREERRFQQERAAPGEELGWEREPAYGGYPAPFQLRAGGYDRGYRPYGADYGYTPGGYGGARGRARAGRRYGGRMREGDRVRASEIMTENPEAVTPEDTIDLAAQKMRDLDVGIIPVVEDAQSRRLVGVITDRDLTVRALAEGKGGRTKVKTCMSEDVSTAREDTPVHELMDIMRTKQVRRVPVVDRENRLVGIVAQADLAVDYAGHDHEREIRVEETIERISEPARPQGRGGYAGGW